MSVSVCLCLCDTLTGCVVNPLDMCRGIFLKISKDVLCAHVIDTCHVDGLQTQPGYSLAPQKSKPRNYRYKNMTTAGFKRKKKKTLCWVPTFLHHVLIQQNCALTAALLRTEMETSRSLLFPLNGLLMNTNVKSFNKPLPVLH